MEGVRELGKWKNGCALEIGAFELDDLEEKGKLKGDS